MMQYHKVNRLRRYTALLLAAALAIGSVSGQPAASKGKGSTLVLKIKKTTYTKKTCQMVKGAKAALTVKSRSL